MSTETHQLSQDTPEKPSVSATPSAPQNREPKAFAYGMYLSEWLTAAALGISSGIVASFHKVHDLFHADSRKATAFKGHFDGYNEQEWKEIVATRFEKERQRYMTHHGDISEEAWGAFKKDEITTALANRPLGRQAELDAIELKDFLNEGKTGKDYRSAIRARKKFQNAEFADIASEFRDIRKNPILGTLDKFETLSPRSMGQLAINGAFGAFIGAAMTLSFFNSVATRDKNDKINEKVDRLHSNNGAETSNRTSSHFREKVDKTAGGTAHVQGIDSSASR